MGQHLFWIAGLTCCSWLSVSASTLAVASSIMTTLAGESTALNGEVLTLHKSSLRSPGQTEQLLLARGQGALVQQSSQTSQSGYQRAEPGGVQGSWFLWELYFNNTLHF